MNSKVDIYLIDGCGRCSYFQTPQCKVHSWTDELKHLRCIVLDCGLHEDFKWSQPCYTFQNKNVLIVTAFKEFASLSFFKGTLLKDTNNILVSPGDNSQASRQIRVNSVKDIVKLETIIKTYICEAIEIENSGLKVKFKKNQEIIPEEFQNKLDESPGLKRAFEELTPGRQRGYILHFSQPKKSKTRTSRIEKFVQKILKGEGLNDNYKAIKK